MNSENNEEETKRFLFERTTPIPLNKNELY